MCHAPFIHLTPDIDENSPEANQFPYLIESKPSKYRHWECDKCGKRYEDPPNQKVQIATNECVFKCPDCNGTLYHMGRKLYHSQCYEDSHYASMIYVTHCICRNEIIDFKKLEE